MQAPVIIPTLLSADVSTADAMDEIQEPVFINNREMQTAQSLHLTFQTSCLMMHVSTTTLV